MNARELVGLLGDPAVVQALRRELGLPSEPVAAELRALTESQARLEDRMGRVEGALDRLTEAQARTDGRIGELVEAQARTDGRIGELVEAQARTDREVAELRKGTEERLQRLEASQERLERAVERLTSSGERLERAVERLTSSGERLERTMEELAGSQAALRTEMGAFSSAYGFVVEDVARTVLPSWLDRHEHLVVDSLEREFVKTAQGEEEIDLYTSVRSGDEDVVVVGEVKSRLGDRDVDQLRAKLERVRPALGEKRVIPLLFGFVVHPKARERGNLLGIRVVASYDR